MADSPAKIILKLVGLFAALCLLIAAGILFFNPIATFQEIVRPTQSIRLSTGEVIKVKETDYGTPDEDGEVQLHFRNDKEDTDEEMGWFFSKDLPDVLKQPEKIKALRGSDHLAIVMGNHLFQRWPEKKGANWYHIGSEPNPAAGKFLRSFQKDADISAQPPKGEKSLKWHEIPAPKVAYRLERFDLEKNTLVTRREGSDPDYPEFLVYSTNRWGNPLELDLLQTRAASNLLPPWEGLYLMDLSVIALPEELYPTTEGFRDRCLSAKGAKEIISASQPLASMEWKTISNAQFPGESRIYRNFEGLFGFEDPIPGYISFFWRTAGIPSTWNFVRVDEWQFLGETTENNGATAIFVRVRKNPQVPGSPKP